jgi:TonB family protein
LSESEEKDLPFARSSIASIGSRRRWRFFGGVVEDEPESFPEASPAEKTSGSDDEPPVRSMLSRLAEEAGDVASAEPLPKAASELRPPDRRRADDDEPLVRSMLGRLADQSTTEAVETRPAATRSMLSLDGAAPTGEDVDVVGPLTQHSTIAELAGLEEHIGSDWPIERGVLISLLFHISLMLTLLFLPARIPNGSKGDLFAMMQPEPRDDTPIPVILDAPGAARHNPKPAPLSDQDRVRGGGDPAKPKADTPFIPRTNGVEGLAPGRRAPRVAGAPAVPPPGAAAQSQKPSKSPGEQEAEKSAEQRPSDFPTQARPKGSGPQEIGKLAGLNEAIRDAARGAVAADGGGEGGAPPASPDGGFVDSGPVSFDTKWYDWGAYAAEMIRRIKLHWDVPELARLGWKGSLTVRYYIMADGTVAEAKIVRFSGIPPFDNAALQAILKSSPFRPLPDALHEQREGVTVTFFYNMRPESEEAKGQP